MFGLTERWKCRVRTINFSAKLPSNLPGISFTCRGKVRLRQAVTASAPAELMAAREARAVALSAIFMLASATTKEFPPEAVFAAEQAITVILANWLSLEAHPAVRVKAKLSLTLLADDAAKAERFSESRRAARLDEALVRDRMSFLRDVALKDENTARLWWLHLNLAGGEAATSWADFDNFVRPLIAHNGPGDDPVTRFTSTMLTLTNRVHENPELLDALSRVAAASLKIMDQIDLAEEITSLAQPVHSTSESHNSFAGD